MLLHHLGYSLSRKALLCETRFCLVTLLFVIFFADRCNHAATLSHNATLAKSAHLELLLFYFFSLFLFYQVVDEGLLILLFVA